MKEAFTRKTRTLIVACFLLCIMLSCAFSVTANAAEVYGDAGGCADILDNRSGRAEITVRVGSKKYFYRDELLPAPDHTVYEEIERRNINAPLAEKLRTVDKCLAAGARWSEAMRYCFPLLPEFVGKIKSENDRLPADSAVKFDPSGRPTFKITREKAGRQIDENRLYCEIFMSLRHSHKVNIEVTPQTVPASVTAEDNIKRTRKISRFTTSFSSSGEGRKQNIRLALRKINGTVLEGGEEFSFNSTVGARTEDNGFSVAKIIVAGEYTDGVGGGVCQASTTLYNAALTAGMEITCVCNHSILPSYVPPSLDSMVNGTSGDLKFINPFDTPVYIRAECEGDRATVTFYGAELPYIIRTLSKELERTAPPPDKEIVDVERKYVGELTPHGTKVRVSYGHSGVKSEGYLRYFTRSGTLIREQKIRTDYYGKTQGVVAVAP